MFKIYLLFETFLLQVKDSHCKGFAVSEKGAFFFDFT